MASAFRGPLENVKSHARRDKLLEIQAQVQKRWTDSNVFNVDAPAKPLDVEKFFGNFPYPYMNGLLHLGHAFTISKLEFAAAYHRLRGEHVLLPFAFHCTGMPIKACADKLAYEMKAFGNPPQFPAKVVQEPVIVKQQDEERAEPAKFKSKKAKAAAKTGDVVYQWQIMQALGLKDEEIPQFTDPLFWLTYFPPLAKEDLQAFGLGCDWRRSFITTDVNPYYDSFVRWHMQTLKNQGKVLKDMRYAIYSPKDGQPCADHDRASGEGVQPQEYTLIKMEVLAPFPEKLKVLEGRKVFLAAATLRPETMYGQTNAWVLPDGEYGAFEINETEVYVITRRAALNLAYQHLSKVSEKPTCLLELSGHDLIGLPLRSPLTTHPVVYALPMLTILTDKGTGVVTSVPSDAPDDYMALMDLKAKPALRQKFGVKDEWVLPFDLIPIINIPEFGDKSAEKVCIDLKIKSQNEKEKLADAKKLTYLKGFTEGTMLLGEYKGEKVQNAKPLIKKMLIETGQAVAYSEPEKKVMSRSGDECVVALTDQWYLTYGESEWKARAEECLAGMELFHDEARHGFEHTLGWLNQWACSRSFGLGTRLPWDPQFLVESLSDSTIYMAYYTVAHYLQGGDLYGQGEGAVQPEQMTHAVWDYLFQGGPVPDTTIPEELLKKMKQEFEYWYPFNLRVSGKDLVQNHLTFAIYNHTAMFPKEKWPLAYRANGHLLLNSEKMAKSKGNFLTLRQAMEDFSSDATRFALADAGDTMEDANFVTETANAAILRLTKEITWMEEVLEAAEDLRTGTDYSFADRVFENEINIAVAVTEKSYSSMMFREALKSGFFDLQAARDEYRLSCSIAGLHKSLIVRFMDVQTRLLTPICPHYAEYVWTEVLKRDTFAVTAGWPAAAPPDYGLQRANKYVQDTITNFRKVLQKQTAPPKKQKQGVKVVVAELTAAVVFVAEEYGGWQKQCLKILQENYNEKTGAFSADSHILSLLSKSLTDDSKKIQKQCMPFIKFKKDETLAVGAQALNLKLPFGELQVLRENLHLIQRQLGLEQVEIQSYSDAEALQRAGPQLSQLQQSPPSPGNPAVVFLTAAVSAQGSELQNGVQNVHIA